MERWGKDNRKEVVMTDIEGIVPKDHLLRKIETRQLLCFAAGETGGDHFHANRLQQGGALHTLAVLPREKARPVGQNNGLFYRGLS